ncbi:alginate lyase family protein [Bacillus alkalicellulosilyticus]|uniref:alginate lyase family protein n=1 Tax=Alkalihalobacterium alkalicellulosilyticum TaxID=1912214 RepID=UPI000997EE8E|nr:alginate lyase family protein [Bacillus alkalicellulosilyticus]
MLKLENVLSVDILLGFPLGKLWIPEDIVVDENESIPNTFFLKGEHLLVIKELVRREESTILWSVEGLRDQAEQFLEIENPSVIQKINRMEQVGTNDYCSFAKYWWPNLETPTGLPYVRKDGEVNPECYSNDSDLSRLELFSEAAFLLAFTAFVTGEKKYAQKATSLIRTWIIEPTTAQTPHFQFGQMIPGNDKPRYQGLIESRRLIYICEALQLLSFMKEIELNEYQQCVAWFHKLLHWIETSEQGKKARKATNNIGFWTDLQQIVYARFTGENELAEKIVREVVLPRIDNQIGKAGNLYHEIKRAKPYDYVAFTLIALAGLSTANKHGEINLADYSSEEGRSFNNAFDWFTDTIKANELQERSYALSQLALSKQSITRLRNENILLENKVKLLEDNDRATSLEAIKSIENNAQNSDLTEKDVLIQQLSEKIRVIENECNQLRSDLHDNMRNVLDTKFYYQGVDVITEEKNKELLRVENELLSVKKDYLNEKDKYKEASMQLKDTEKEVVKLQQLYKDLKEKYAEVKQERNRYKNKFIKIEQSRIWRYTSGLRKVLSFVKRKVVKK